MLNRPGFLGRWARLGLGSGLLAIAGLALGAIPEAEAGTDPVSVEAREAFAAQQVDGAKVYARLCSSCHMANGEGVAGMFPPLAGSEWVTGPEDRLIKIILHGIHGEIEVAGEMYNGHMPPWGGSLNDAELAALATYIRNAWGNKAPAVKAATVAQVRKETADRKTSWTAEELALSSSKVK